MVVQHNLRAMNSNRMLGITSGTLSKSSEKLSSGYKINRAADDAAGLSISEKMRKQIRGLTQATANAEDGISAVQTAEGALTEVHDMLQRMNELAVKAANGTMSESDRTAVQNEVDQLATEIDRVAETTKFNETYLLKGDKDVEKSNSYSYKAVKNTVKAEATMGQDKATNLTAQIAFKSGANAADQNTVAKALRDQGITITSKQNDDKNGATYSVTLNGSAANSYKVNTITAAGTNDGKSLTAGAVGTNMAKFEIVDLQGNKIADIMVAGGIGTDVAAESSKVITAETVKAAENQGDVKQFYDADGNAISENALGNYFSKLASGGVAKMLYTADGTAITKKEDIPADTTLYTALAGTETDKDGNTVADANKTLGTIDLSGVVGAITGDVYMHNGTEWVYKTAGSGSAHRAGDQVEGVIKYTGYTTSGVTITTGAADTTKVAAAGTAKINDTKAVYDATGKKYTAAELAAALDANADAADELYTTDTRKLTVAEKGGGTANQLAGLQDAGLKDGVVAEFGFGTYTWDATNNVWNEAGGDTVEMDDMLAVLAKTGADASIFEDGDEIKIEDDSANSGTLITKGEAGDYTYTPGKATMDVEEVAAQAGKMLYDAVGNAYDGNANENTMEDAAKLVASNNNLTGALILSLHVGADATKNNQIDLKIEAMSAKGLGINGIRVDGKNDSNALKSVETIKEAIAKVSAQRSALGAVQNRLEHTINNLENVVENTTSAESAIRDTDMATEMVKFSNSNILAQAGQSMLAQANQANQGVLSLLG